MIFYIVLLQLHLCKALKAVCVGVCVSEVLKDCCLSVSKNRVPAKFVVSYYIQEAGKGCNLSATVFETKGGRRLCIVHPDGFPWVQKVISKCRVHF
uniref:Chemokine interleukin-8-like domain-containing protein n=1 Tax=Oryzias melastigma TaxID=30732 RepID=A0A3B3CTQ1_ORYME